jgi:NAD(P)-dependent dehydrogenase (short-subunit alcohol dehydrogenase family)
MKLTIPKKDIGIPAKGQKVAVVTGGASGIGKCIAGEFRRQGVKVYVIDKAPGDHYVGDCSGGNRAVCSSQRRALLCESGVPY